MSEAFFPTFSEEIEPDIAFHCEDVPEPDIDLTLLPDWINAVIAHHQATLGELQYIFCSDAYLHQLNLEYLQHDTLTDIITFPYAEPPLVSGDLYISLERVADNALDHQLPFATELHRVIIHGVLHLCGYGDKTPAEAARMRVLEEEALALRKS